MYCEITAPARPWLCDLPKLALAAFSFPVLVFLLRIRLNSSHFYLARNLQFRPQEVPGDRRAPTPPPSTQVLRSASSCLSRRPNFPSIFTFNQKNMVLTNRTCPAINDLSSEQTSFWDGRWDAHEGLSRSHARCTGRWCHELIAGMM